MKSLAQFEREIRDKMMKGFAKIFMKIFGSLFVYVKETFVNIRVSQVMLNGFTVIIVFPQ